MDLKLCGRVSVSGNVGLRYSGWAFSGQLMDGGGRFWPPVTKIHHTYPTMIKLGSYILPKKDPKNV